MPSEGSHFWKESVTVDRAVKREPFIRAVVFGDAVPPVPSLRAEAGNRLPLSPLTIYVGENGSGKSTLLQAIAAEAGINPSGGSPHATFAAPNVRQGDGWLRLVRGARRPRSSFFLRADSLLQMGGWLDELSPDAADPYGGSLTRQSHGEAMMSVALTRLRRPGLYLFDEPEAGLSLTSQLALMAKFGELLGIGSQLLVATHSPFLLSFPGAAVMSLQPDGIKPTHADEVADLKLARTLLNEPQSVLRHLGLDD